MTAVRKPAEPPFAVSVEDFDAWVARAEPKDALIYARGADIPRAAPAWKHAMALVEEGMITLTYQRAGGGITEYLAIRLTTANAPAVPVVALPGVYGQRADAIRRNNEGPAEGYMRSLNVSAAAMNEQVESIGVSALKDLNSQLSDAILGTRSLASAFADMGKRIMASLIDIAIQQSVIKPLAASLFGGSGGSGGGFFGSMTSLLASTFGGGKAKGGGIDPSSWYVVGEKGPEVFAPGVSGTVIPNGGRGSGGRGGNTYVDMRGAMVDTDVWAKVDSIASYRAGEAYQASASHTETALAGVARQRL